MEFFRAKEEEMPKEIAVIENKINIYFVFV